MDNKTVAKNHDNNLEYIALQQKESTEVAVNYPDSRDRAISQDEREAKRGTWAKELDFILACVGWAVGVGNIWRFPYLCYKNGGGRRSSKRMAYVVRKGVFGTSQICKLVRRVDEIAVKGPYKPLIDCYMTLSQGFIESSDAHVGRGAFLIPYMICVVTCGVPIFILEIALGQYMKRGGIGTWNIIPAFQGIGVASFSITTFMNIYYIIVLTWAAFYLYMSCSSTLPWSRCDNYWNTERCFDGNNPSLQLNVTKGVATNLDSPPIYNRTIDSTVEFWERRVLQRSNGIDEPAGLQLELVLSLFIVWVLVYFCVWRGVRWTGKVVYFTALLPYVILIILLVRGLTLEGASEGIKFFLKPDFSRLSDPQVWVDGGTQIFFSYSVGLGAMISLSSYNKFNYNFYRDCIIVSCVNTSTSLLGGFVVFSVLGFMAHEQGTTISEVAEAGPGLVFIVYPKAVTQMPIPTLWSILFFLMVVLVGLDSQFVAVEALLTPIFDMLPKKMYKMKYRMLATALYCFLTFLAGLCMVTKGGIYVFQLFDYYSASGFVLLWVCFFETVIISWVFGTDRFMDVIELMLGRRIPYWFAFCWRFMTPVVSTGIFVFMLVDFQPLKYNNVYEYPVLAQLLGGALALVSMSWIPLVFCYKFFQYPGNLKEKWQDSTTPVLRMLQIPTEWDLRKVRVISK